MYFASSKNLAIVYLFNTLLAFMQKDVPKMAHPLLLYWISFPKLIFSKLKEPYNKLVFGVHFLLKFLNLRIVDVVVIVHQFVYGSIGCKLNDSVGYCLDELMVVA